jgi:ribonuclease HIII
MPNKVLKFQPSQKEDLEKILQKLGLEKEDNPNVLFSYRSKDFKVIFYPTGTLLIQGKGDVDQLAEKIVSNLSVETNYIGSDEAGKGDLFGPLVVCSFGLTSKNLKKVLSLGVRDSKNLPKESLHNIAKELLKLSTYSCVVILPQTYNEIYPDFGNLNKLLAVSHANVIERLYLKLGLKKAVVDKFTKAPYLKRALTCPISLVEETKAERYPAVAAASILARYHYEIYLEKLSRSLGIQLPPGSGPQAKKIYKLIEQKYGLNILKKVAKLHFKV